MYDTERIYNQAFSECLNSLKQYRDQWNYSPENQIYSDIKRYTDIWNDDTQQYAFLQKQTKEAICKALIKIVQNLLTEYKYAVKYVNIEKCLSFLKIGFLTVANCPEADNLFSFICIHNDGRRVLYFFREYGMQSRIDDGFVEHLRSLIAFDVYTQISWVDKKAYSEIINHNNNENDPGRGTNTYSFDLFFERFFGKDELARFHQKYDAFKKEVLDYCCIALIKIQKPNVVFSYRNALCKSLSSYDYDAAIEKYSGHKLSPDQKRLIEAQFVGKKFMSALVSLSNYAKCFMTAEWLYSSLEDSAGTIDLTSISMGYLKALEQFMYAFIGLHTCEKDNKQRKISIWEGSKERKFNFTDALYKKEKKMTLGNMTKFLKSWDNRDLLRTEIDDTTFEIICDVLSRTSDQRNDYFHKENIENWSKVVDARDLAFILFYFFLGAYDFSDLGKNTLDIGCLEINDEYDKLFEYINRRYYEHGELEIPIIYLSETSDKFDFWCPYPDEEITYNELGKPQYTGLYLRRLKEKKYSQVFIKDTMPENLFEGNYIIDRLDPENGWPIGPLKKIFNNGVFTLE